MATMTETYTWTPGKRYCDSETHKTSATCADCENSGTCADCGRKVTGPAYLLCVQTGEVTHAGCDRMAATTTW
ncbi:hypothetical protein [Verrucosispora sp. NA02020]|uniref:hypothetical protein n=1 Tax=Verrucosispora sp. NA02020 TaxID=2742132 RepID=UPI003D732B18